MRRRAPLKGLVNGAFLDGIGGAVRFGMMHELVHVRAKQGLRVAISQQTGTGGIAEGTAALQIDTVNRLSGGIQQQSYLFLSGAQLRLGPQNTPANGERRPTTDE